MGRGHALVDTVMKMENFVIDSKKSLSFMETVKCFFWCVGSYANTGAYDNNTSAPSSVYSGNCDL